jgi:hypothetical protein
MTTTTSKLGADMTDFQINLLASNYWEIKEVMGVRTDKFDAVGFARALLARQPAAIDKQDERGDAPLSLIPELVKQDQCAVGDALLDMGDAMVDWSTEVGKYREITSLAQSAFSDGYEAGIAAILRARAASTSANVAQGAEAVGWFMQRSKFGPWVEVEQQEPGAEQFYRGAPPAQTALTDDVLMQAIADTAARGHVWASRALSNFRAVVRQVSKSPNDA